MDSVANLKEADRRDLFTQTAANKSMTAAIVEKDFWVTWTLGKIFSNTDLKQKLRFKGGTSLSKVFGLIERFSEDIDLILNWNLLTEQDLQEERSGKKQKELVKEIREKGREFIVADLLPKISAEVSPVCRCNLADDDRNVVNLYYPKAFSDDYIRPEIRLEIGPIASWLPFGTHTIKPYAAEQFPKVFTNPSCEVQVINAERTFWEKATILHHEANRPENNKQPPRLSRHYYDLAQMAKSPIKEKALSNIHILQTVAEFKKKFYPRGWARYEEARPGTLKLVPKEHALQAFIEDYRNMENIIHTKR